ncbi:cellobiose dehydrogenase [Metarhizium anisopliae]
MTLLASLWLGALFLATLGRASAVANWTLQSWDVIVVGAGTAGIIVADRLSEAGYKTLLLQQGGQSYGITGGRERPGWLDNTTLSRVDVPGLYSSIFAGGSSLLCGPGQVDAFQACAVGGNSAINAGLYFQPPASDWDDFHPRGWHSADVANATARLLKRQPALTSYSQDDKYYLQSGYEAVKKWIVEDGGYQDVSLLEQVNDKKRVFGRPVYNYIDGQRGGPTRTYLQTALRRNHFHLQTGVQVEHINHVKGVASSVEVALDSGEKKAIQLTKRGRVVLSAGAMLSPRILMLSGIGPQDALEKLAAKSATPYNASSWMVRPDVGRGLFDNPNTFIVLSSPDVKSYVYKYDDPVPADRDLYLESRSGPYSFASQTSVFWTYIEHNGTRSGVQGTVSSSGYRDFVGNNTITLNIYGTSGLLSSGHVELADDGSFAAKPSAGVYYGHPRDADAVAEFIHSLFQHLPPSTPTSPAKEGLTPLNLARNSTLQEIRRYITDPNSPYAVGSVQHWSSSCRIGKCVDVDTKVIGTQNIHVVDASILAPLTVNPQFGVMVAAEKGSERIIASMKNVTEGCRGRRRV